MLKKKYHPKSICMAHGRFTRNYDKPIVGRLIIGADIQYYESFWDRIKQKITLKMHSDNGSDGAFFLCL